MSNLELHPHHLTWHPGPDILYSTPKLRKKKLNPKTEAEEFLFMADSSERVQTACYSPNGNQIAYLWQSAGRNTGLRKMDLNNGSRKFLKYGAISPIVWSSDGDWIYALNYVDMNLIRISPDYRATEVVLNICDVFNIPHNVRPSINISPDGKKFIYSITNTIFVLLARNK